MSAVIEVTEWGSRKSIFIKRVLDWSHMTMCLRLERVSPYCKAALTARHRACVWSMPHTVSLWMCSPAQCMVMSPMWAWLCVWYCTNVCKSEGVGCTSTSLCRLVMVSGGFGMYVRWGCDHSPAVHGSVAMYVEGPRSCEARERFVIGWKWSGQYQHLS